MINITVICPIYKGKKYIRKIINIIEQNFSEINKKQKTCVELILVNDYPEESLEVYSSDKIIIRCIENNKNEGIHASRVIGLNKAQGEYVLFLDQDDEISYTWLVKQYNMILGADAVVCNGYLCQNDGRKIIYENYEMHQKICDIDNYIYNNLIVSPGQVLIRKASIPQIWKENIIKNNGADDLYLWLLMLSQKCTFKIDNEVLYIHNQTGNNASKNYMAMMMSRLEILFDLEKRNLLSERFITLNKEYLLQILYKKAHHAGIFDQWMTLLEKGYSLDKILKNDGYKNIAIYGMGVLGRHLVKQLENSKVNVIYIIDRNATLTYKNIKVIKLGEQMDNIDAIIVTPAAEYNCIKKELLDYYNCEIISFENMITDLIKD